MKWRDLDLTTPAILAVVLGLMVAGYLIFPWALRQASYQACIASGRITGC